MPGLAQAVLHASVYEWHAHRWLGCAGTHTTCKFAHDTTWLLSRTGLGSRTRFLWWLSVLVAVCIGSCVFPVLSSEHVVRGVESPATPRNRHKQQRPAFPWMHPCTGQCCCRCRCRGGILKCTTGVGWSPRVGVGRACVSMLVLLCYVLVDVVT